MGFMANLKGQKAYKLHAAGKLEEARPLYAQALAEGMNQPRLMLSYAVLLIRLGEYEQARDLLLRIQKLPGLAPEQKNQLFMNYATCVYKMGQIDKGISLLERQCSKQPAGNLYQTLGYLYVEKLEDKPDPAAPAPVSAPTADEDDAEAAAPAEPLLTPYQQWEQLRDKALAFCKEALEYDEEDAICLDNMGQLLYRIYGDTEGAKPYFEKAHEIKPRQIDTLWFLSRYDLEKGDRDAAVAKLQKMVDGRYSVLNYITRDGVLAELERLGAKPEEDDV